MHLLLQSVLCLEDWAGQCPCRGRRGREIMGTNGLALRHVQSAGAARYRVARLNPSKATDAAVPVQPPSEYSVVGAAEGASLQTELGSYLEEFLDYPVPVPPRTLRASADACRIGFSEEYQD